MVGFYVLAFIFFAAGRIKTYTFNRKTDKFTITKTNMICIR